MSRLFLQDSPNDRAVACLATILNHHGLFITPVDLGKEMVSSRSGNTPDEFVATAARYDFQAALRRVDIDKFHQVPTPFMAFTADELDRRENQPLVIFKVRGERLWVGDPGLGKYVTTRREFSARYQGRLMTFQPGPAYHPRVLSESYWARFLKFVKAYRGKILLSLLLGVLTSVIGFGLVYFTKLFVDLILPQNRMNPLWIFVLVYLMARLLQVAIGAANRFYTVTIRNAVARVLSRTVFRHMTRLEKRHLDQRDKGELMEQFSQIESLTEGMASYFGNFILVALGLGLKALLLILLYDWVLVSILLVILVLNGLLGFLFSRRVAERTNRSGILSGMMNTTLLDGLTDIRVIRLFGARSWIRDQFAHLLDKILKLTRDLTTLRVYGRSLADLLNILSEAAIFIVCGARIMEGSYTIGDFLLFFTFAQSMNAESLQFPELILSFPVQLRAFARVQGILALSRESGGKQTPREGPLEIEFQKVSFGYEKHKDVLKDVSFVLQAGKTTAFVGESGSGKTTIMNLMMGFYQPSAGKILVNGMNQAELDLDRYRAGIAAVLQDAPLLGKTLFQNVGMGHPAITRQQVAETARLLGMASFIETLPMEYDQLLYPGALSGGQSQQVGILRAMCKPFRLLIMDEATSHLDSRTEARVVKGIHTLAKGKTRAIIAHRLNTVKAADKIIVMQDGRIAEMGTHQDLIEKKGSYLELVQRQYEVDMAPPPQPAGGTT